MTLRGMWKALDKRIVITGVLAGATVLVAVAGYAAQGVQYSHLFELYQKQNQQLRDNGIEPTTPTPEQVAQAGPVGATGAKGEKGDTGNEGPSPTMNELVQAFALYCQTYGCTGSVGTAGTNGTNGKDGTNGVNGTNGANGTDGRGIASVTCVLKDDFTTAFRFTLTDSTTQDVPAMCTPS